MPETSVDLPEPVRKHAEAALVKVVELGNFADAARALGLSPQTVIRLLHALESTCRTRLVVRRRASIQPTEAGAAYVRTLRNGEAVAATPEPPAVLCLDLCTFEARSLVVPAMQRFCLMHPEIAPVLVGRLREQGAWPPGLDAALRLGTEFARQPGATVLGSYSRVTCASVEYLQRHGIPARLDELDEHCAVHRVSDADADAPAFTFGLEGHGEVEVPVPCALATDDLELQVAAVLGGRGIAQLPLTAALRYYLARGKLVALLQPYDTGTVPIVLLRAPQPRATVTAFAGWLATLYESECRRLAAYGAREAVPGDTPAAAPPATVLPTGIGRAR